MQWHRNDEVAGERLTFAALFQNIAERLCERHTIRILEMVNDLAERVCEEQCRSREIERMLAHATESAQTFNRGSRLAALWAKRRFDRHEARPAFRTCPSPSALRNRSVTDDTREWEQEIENVVEQSAFGETQRAKEVYTKIISRKANCE